MKILGITLAFPDMASLTAALATGGMFVMVFVALTAFDVIRPMDAAMLAASSVGGALANAYGASIKQSGWQGAVVSIAFSAFLMTLVYVIWSLN